MATDSKTGKLPAIVKLAYGFGEIGKNLIIYLTNYYLLYFYTDVALVPAAAATIILLVAKVWSAVFGPIMGTVCDRKVSKLGKCRYFLGTFAV